MSSDHYFRIGMKRLRQALLALIKGQDDLMKMNARFARAELLTAWKRWRDGQ